MICYVPFVLVLVMPIQDPPAKADAKQLEKLWEELASDDAAYITGQTLFVDGGLTLYPSFETTWSSE